MLVGIPPFYDGALICIPTHMGLMPIVISEVTDKMYEKILNDPLVFPEDISPQAQDILTKLLDRNPTQRLGVNGAGEIKKHPFFDKNIDFKVLLQKKIRPPFKPSVSSPVVRLHAYRSRVTSRAHTNHQQDVSNFDTVFTEEVALDSVVEDSQLSQTVQEQFAGTCSVSISMSTTFS